MMEDRRPSMWWRVSTTMRLAHTPEPNTIAPLLVRRQRRAKGLDTLAGGTPVRITDRFFYLISIIPTRSKHRDVNIYDFSLCIKGLFYKPYVLKAMFIGSLAPHTISNSYRYFMHYLKVGMIKGRIYILYNFMLRVIKS
jgi:hypothetical protein